MIERADPLRIVADIHLSRHARPPRSPAQMHDSQLGAPHALPLPLIQLGFNGGFAAAFASVANADEALHV
jgi:hypothetical protein